ncbi:uncharacterized protein LOC134531988 [Bacillus rossius redtenbacheri]|uniref:uncharacterized protein LOC134531988 n=1 Tax=Bacillus rossius redtenbacheri TaxID=93214 RepID=UPI002FDD2B75
MKQEKPAGPVAAEKTPPPKDDKAKRPAASPRRYPEISQEELRRLVLQSFVGHVPRDWRQEPRASELEEPPTARRASRQYSDSNGVRCACGALIPPEHVEDGDEDPECLECSEFRKKVYESFLQISPNQMRRRSSQ